MSQSEAAAPKLEAQARVLLEKLRTRGKEPLLLGAEADAVVRWMMKQGSVEVDEPNPGMFVVHLRART